MRKIRKIGGFIKGTLIILLIAVIFVFASRFVAKNGQGSQSIASPESTEQIESMEQSVYESRSNSPGRSLGGQRSSAESGQSRKAASPSQPSQNNILNSSNAILIQLGKYGNKVLFDKGGGEKIFPASMTKIMTAVIALENIENPDTVITLNEAMFVDIYSSNSSMAGFLPGEKVRAIDLLYGLMLPSGAECAIGLAEYVSGTEVAFVDLMNQKARQLGMNETHFVNSTGLHNQGHFSTVKDIAILLEYAIQNDTLYKLLSAAKYSTKPTNRHADGITFYSTLFSRMRDTSFDGGVILGGKTGYTDEAGQCLASLAEKDGKRFILVTCGAPGDNKTQRLHIDDAFMVFGAMG